MNLHKMIEICLKDDNMHIIGVINALNCINNHIITCINNMLSMCDPTYMMSMGDRVAIGMETPMIDIRRSLKEDFTELI